MEMWHYSLAEQRNSGCFSDSPRNVEERSHRNGQYNMIKVEENGWLGLLYFCFVVYLMPPDGYRKWFRRNVIETNNSIKTHFLENKYKQVNIKLPAQRQPIT